MACKNPLFEYFVQKKNGPYIYNVVYQKANIWMKCRRINYLSWSLITNIYESTFLCKK